MIIYTSSTHPQETPLWVQIIEEHGPKLYFIEWNLLTNSFLLLVEETEQKGTRD